MRRRYSWRDGDYPPMGYDPDPPARRPVHRCTDGFCGAIDCDRCHPGAGLEDLTEDDDTEDDDACD